jgi:hypothetical protein
MRDSAGNAEFWGKHYEYARVMQNSSEQVEKRLVERTVHYDPAKPRTDRSGSAYVLPYYVSY